MKYLFTLIVFLHTALHPYAQVPDSYAAIVARAGLLHLQNKPTEAIGLYERAFRLKEPDALTAYKAAGMYAHNGNSDRAFHYLHLALERGWTESEWLAGDAYFESLRVDHADRWLKLLTEARKKEENYATTLLLPHLRKEIITMTLEDQQLRYKRIQSNTDSLRNAYDQQIRQSDNRHLNRAKQIIAEFGWPETRRLASTVRTTCGYWYSMPTRISLSNWPP